MAVATRDHRQAPVPQHHLLLAFLQHRSHVRTAFRSSGRWTRPIRTCTRSRSSSTGAAWRCSDRRTGRRLRPTFNASTTISTTKTWFVDWFAEQFLTQVEQPPQRRDGDYADDVSQLHAGVAGNTSERVAGERRDQPRDVGDAAVEGGLWAHKLRRSLRGDEPAAARGPGLHARGHHRQRRLEQGVVQPVRAAGGVRVRLPHGACPGHDLLLDGPRQDDAGRLAAHLGLRVELYDRRRAATATASLCLRRHRLPSEGHGFILADAYVRAGRTRRRTSAAPRSSSPSSAPTPLPARVVPEAGDRRRPAGRSHQSAPVRPVVGRACSDRDRGHQQGCRHELDRERDHVEHAARGRHRVGTRDGRRDDRRLVRSRPDDADPGGTGGGADHGVDRAPAVDSLPHTSRSGRASRPRRRRW